MLELSVGPHDATLLSAQKLVELDPADMKRRLLLGRVETALSTRINP